MYIVNGQTFIWYFLDEHKFIMNDYNLLAKAWGTVLLYRGEVLIDCIKRQDTTDTIRKLEALLEEFLLFRLQERLGAEL